MKRWNANTSKEEECEKCDAFLADILAVYEKHGLALSHEDGHGAFLITNDPDPFYKKWLLAAGKEFI